MKIAHLSDLHFASWDWNLSQMFSKRWLGNLNFLFGRRHDFDHDRLNSLPSLFKSLDVSKVLITGDLSNTSAPAEFLTAKKFVETLEDQGIYALVIPGNHDHYTQLSYYNRHFYNHFPSSWDGSLPCNLKEDGVTAKKCDTGWWIVGLDTALATSLFYSTGYFSPEIEKKLEQLLEHIPSEDPILLANHFPFFLHESRRKQLVRGSALQKLIEKHPQIKVYCHGHTHRRCFAPLKESGLPLILDPGSTPHLKNGGWYLLDLQENQVTIEHYEWKERWSPSLQEMESIS